MKKEINDKYFDLAKIFKAICHPSRLYIIDRLKKEPVCVSKLSEEIGDDISTISRHLKVLKEADIIVDERDGNKIRYRLIMKCVPTTVIPCIKKARCISD